MVQGGTPSSWAAQGSPLPSKGCEKQESATSSGWRTVCSMQALGQRQLHVPQIEGVAQHLVHYSGHIPALHKQYQFSSDGYQIPSSLHAKGNPIERLQFI